MIDENLLLEIMAQQGWVFPLSFPLILNEKGIEDMGLLQCYLKTIQYINQDGLCICGKELNGDAELHHALLSRNDALGLENPNCIHHSYNVVLLHHNCHKKIRRFLCIIYLAKIFGFYNIQKWYLSTRNKTILRGFQNV